MKLIYALSKSHGPSSSRRFSRIIVSRIGRPHDLQQPQYRDGPSCRNGSPFMKILCGGGTTVGLRVEMSKEDVVANEHGRSECWCSSV
jgi:hypothetical protein